MHYHVQGNRHTPIQCVQRTWLFREMQLEVFLFEDFHAAHMLANNFIGAFDGKIARGKGDVFHGKISAADNLVFVGPDEHHWGAIGISCDGVQPKFDEQDRVLLVALAVFVTS